MPITEEQYSQMFNEGVVGRVVPPKSRLGRFATGVMGDMAPAFPAVDFAGEPGLSAARFLLEDPEEVARARQRGEEPVAEGRVPRPDLAGSQHPRQRELDEAEEKYNIEQEAAERQAMLRQGYGQYGPGVFGRRDAGQGGTTSAFGRTHPTVSTGGQVSFMQASGTPTAEARVQEEQQQRIYANRLQQQEELSRLNPVQQARLQAASRYRPDAAMQMFQTGMAVAQRYSRDIEAINGMQGLSDAQRAAALENLNGQYEPYFRVLGLSRGVSVPAFGGYGPGME